MTKDDLDTLGDALAEAEAEVDRAWRVYRAAADHRNRLAEVWARFWSLYDGPTGHTGGESPSWSESELRAAYGDR